MIYLDHHATTPLDPAAAEAMRPWWTDLAANAGSAHAPGWRAAAAVDDARRTLGRLIGARASEIVFTSGATEGANLALLGRFATPGGHLLISAIEHPAVAEPARMLAARGVAVEVVPVDREGRVDPAAVAARLRPDTRLVSIQAANHEIGTIQPLAAIGAVCRARGATFHVDAAQAVGRVPVDACDCDLMSFSAHKMHGPPGIGALYVRAGTLLSPILFGGGQQAGLRPGTVPVPLAVGFGAAAGIAREGIVGDAARIAALRDTLLARLVDDVPGLVLNGPPPGARLPGNLSLTLPDLSAEELMLRVPELALSAGSACTADSGRPSPVLAAIGLDEHAAFRTIRIGIGRFNTAAEIERAAAMIAAACADPPTAT